jgi:hypothetical protein
VGWPEFLDDIESRLADVERELNSGGPAVSPFALPDDLGPLPEQLRERAAAALHRTEMMQAEVERARDRLGDALRRGRAVSREPAAYFDAWV